MAKISSNQKQKLLNKLKAINIITEKDILNIKLTELKKINETEEIENLTIKDIEIIWLIQEAVEKKSLLEFFTNSE